MAPRMIQFETVATKHRNYRKARRETRIGEHHIAWSKAAPFSVNRRSGLVHRVKSGHTHIYDGQFSHTSATYWCGNSSCGQTVTDNPPTDLIHCQLCESKAIGFGLPAASEILGRQVTLGKFKPVPVYTTP